jgi:O-antigen ligase
MKRLFFVGVFMMLYPLLFMAVFFAHYLIMPYGFGGVDAQRMVFVSAIAVILARFALHYHQKFALVLSLSFAAVAVWVDLPFNPYVKQITYILLLIGTITLLMAEEIHDEYIVATFATCALVSFVLIGACYAVFFSLGLAFNWKECFAFFSHPRFFNHFQVGAVLLFPMLILKSDSKVTRVLAFLALSLSVATILVSAGRGIWVSLTAAALVIACLRIRHYQRYFTFLILGVIAGFFVFLIFSYLSSPSGSLVLAGLEERGSVLADNRSRIWELTVAKIIERPVLGWGAYSYAFLAGEIWLPAHPHQAVLQLAFEYGLPLTSVIVAFFTYSIYTLFKRIRLLNNDWASVYFASLIALALNAQYSAVLIMPVGQMMVVVITARLLSLVFSEWITTLKSMLVLPRKLLPTSFFILMGGAVMIWGIVIEDYLRFRGEGEWSKRHEKRIFLPRTWENAS